MNRADLAWNIIVELRGELKEAQKIRAQIIGVKIAFVAAAAGFIVGAGGQPNYDLVIVPAVASIFFDYLIVSYGVSIKRIGYYCRTYLEPKLRDESKWPEDEPLWEEAMSQRPMRQHFAGFGNIGMSALVVIPAIAHLVANQPFAPVLSYLVACLLGILFLVDLLFIYVFKYAPREPLVWPPPDSGAA